MVSKQAKSLGRRWEKGYTSWGNLSLFPFPFGRGRKQGVPQDRKCLPSRSVVTLLYMAALIGGVHY